MLLVLGILVMAGEFRHGTATSTFLITPDRRRVVAAKVVAASLVGVVLALVTSVVTLAVAIPWLQADGVDVASYGSDIALGLLGSIAATALAPARRRRIRCRRDQSDCRHHDRPDLEPGGGGPAGRLPAGGRALAARRRRERALGYRDAERRDAADVGGRGRAGRYGLAFAAAGAAALARRDVA